MGNVYSRSLLQALLAGCLIRPVDRKSLSDLELYLLSSAKK
jgi:hypothetical protein